MLLFVTDVKSFWFRHGHEHWAWQIISYFVSRVSHSIIFRSVRIFAIFHYVPSSSHRVSRHFSPFPKESFISFCLQTAKHLFFFSLYILLCFVYVLFLFQSQMHFFSFLVLLCNFLSAKQAAYSIPLYKFIQHTKHRLQQFRIIIKIYMYILMYEWVDRLILNACVFLWDFFFCYFGPATLIKQCIPNAVDVTLFGCLVIAFGRLYRWRDS